MRRITPPIVSRCVVVVLPFLFSCASFQIPQMPQSSADAPGFPYSYYVIEPDGYKGSSAERDLAMDACEAVGSCMMMKTDDFYNLKTEYQSLKLKVINRELTNP